MHVYAIAADRRSKVHLALAAISILAAWSFSAALNAAQVTIAWWIDAPSVLGFYAVFHQLFDRLLWKQRWARLLGLSDIPDLSGLWIGHITSSYDANATQHDATLEIRQTWTQLLVSFKGKYSVSRSQSGSLEVLDEQSGTLSYEYVSEPMSGAVPTMQMHRGTAILLLRRREDGTGHTLEGDYYTGRGRQSVGRMTFFRDPGGERRST